MKKVILTFLFLLFYNFAFAEITNKDIEKFVDTMSKRSQSIVNNEKLTEKQRQEEYKNFASDIVDANWVAKFVLGRNWRDLTPAQQQEFLELYREYLLQNYMPKIKDYNKEVKVDKIVKQKEKVFMVSLKTKDKTNRDVFVDFRLIDKDGKILITDIIPEGISFISNQRSDINSAISQNGYDKFIKSLRERVEKNK